MTVYFYEFEFETTVNEVLKDIFQLKKIRFYPLYFKNLKSFERIFQNIP